LDRRELINHLVERRNQVVKYTMIMDFAKEFKAERNSDDSRVFTGISRK
jgi:hypothetical protein